MIRSETRLAVGFHRIGLILAIPTAICGGACFAAAPFSRTPEVPAFIAAALLLGAALLYAASWATGWAVRGFAGEPKSETAPQRRDPLKPLEPAKETVADPVWVKRAPPDGFRGWLLLPAFGTIIAPFVAAKGIVDLMQTVVQAQDRSHPVFLFVYGEIAINCAMAAFNIWVLVLMVRRNRQYPKFFIAALVTSIVVVTTDAVLAQALFNITIDQEAVRSIGRSIGVAVIWIPYMLRSKRVALTFVR